MLNGRQTAHHTRIGTAAKHRRANVDVRVQIQHRITCRHRVNRRTIALIIDLR
jgi:hypothetical protein